VVLPLIFLALEFYGVRP